MFIFASIGWLYRKTGIYSMHGNMSAVKNKQLKAYLKKYNHYTILKTNAVFPLIISQQSAKCTVIWGSGSTENKATLIARSHQVQIRIIAKLKCINYAMHPLFPYSQNWN